MLDGDLGSGAAFAEALAEFAVRYADQTREGLAGVAQKFDSRIAERRIAR